MTALLDVEDLHASYAATPVLHGIDLRLAEGSITALLGANGAGKTTMLRALCQTFVRTTGRISFAGRRTDAMATEDIVRLGIAHVPDGRGTFTHLTVEENLRMGGFSRSDRKGVADDIEQAYDRFPRLRERRRQQAGTLSGGEQQMLAVSRALMLRPRLLLLDEPSFGLAPLVVEEIFAMLRRINTQDKVSILLVEQNAAMALDIADSAYLIETGRVVLQGTAAEIQRNDAVRRSYLGF